MLLDKLSLAANKAHNTKTVFRKLLDEYGIEAYHEYKGIVFAGYNDRFTIKHPAYSVKYDAMCNHLLSGSNAVFRQEKAIDVHDDILITDKSRYRFRYLVDCTGRSFFLRKKFKLPVSTRFWLANLSILKNNTDIGTDYLYWLTDEKGYFEEFCPFKDHLAVGDYQYTDSLDFKKITPPKNLLRDTLVKKKIVLEKSFGIIPNSPHFPMVFRERYIFLGDSFGNAATGSAYGTEPILETSKILAWCIKENRLGMYEKLWKQKYLEAYIRYLAMKYDSYNNSALLEKIKAYRNKQSIMRFFKKNPDVALKFLMDPSYVIDIKKYAHYKSPFLQKLFRLYYYTKLKTRAYTEGLRRS